VADFPVPTGREEEWRFTPLDRLRGLHDGTAGEGGRADSTLHVEVEADPAVTVETVGRDDPRVGAAGMPVDRVAAQAFSSFEKATVLTVASEQVTAAPTVLRLRGQGGTAYGHLVVDVKQFAEAVVVLDHSGSATYADNVEFLVGDSARLTVVSLQDWDDDAVHLSHHVARLGRDARFKSVEVTFGGDLVRVFPRVTYAGPGGDADLLGLFFADSGQHLEHRLLVDHAVPHCRSRVTYKGALQGQDAHTVWIGDVLIRTVAEGTDTYELNRNLVLTDGARADSVPNLEIETGEIVGAGHASATGRFDDEQLFYLMARGIPAEEARRLVVRGFFAEVIAQIGIPEIEERLLAEVEDELAGAVT
jgi:Fe-S cluster assembly protein SufD